MDGKGILREDEIMKETFKKAVLVGPVCEGYGCTTDNGDGGAATIHRVDAPSKPTHYRP